VARLIAVVAGILALCSAAAYTYDDPGHSLDGPTAQTERGRSTVTPRTAPSAGALAPAGRAALRHARARLSPAP
jgi:hypothetical protein